MAKAFSLGQGGGALVAEVTPGSPAAKAGIERGDIILELNGQAVNEPDDLSVRIAEIAPGTPVHLKISRNGQMREVTATLGELNEKQEAMENGDAKVGPMQGVQVQNLTPAVARDLGISAGTTGVVVTSVDTGSPAAAAGLDRGDVIQQVNRKPVHSASEYNEALAATHNQSVLLLVSHGQATRFLVVESQ